MSLGRAFLRDPKPKPVNARPGSSRQAQKMPEWPASEDCDDGFAAVKVRVVVGEDDSPEVMLTEVGLSAHVGAVAAEGGCPVILGEMLHESVTSPT